MIPPFEKEGVLPVGIHETTWKEFSRRFGGTMHRRVLLKKLRAGLDNLRDAGCHWVLLDGSFTTNNPDPQDVDGCWEWSQDIDLSRLEPVFLLQSWDDRLVLQHQYGMDFFLSGIIEAGSGKPFSVFFQSDRDGNPKGIIRIDLSKERKGGISE